MLCSSVSEPRDMTDREVTIVGKYYNSIVLSNDEDY